jgi:apolipoprotein N-acyltransferase
MPLGFLTPISLAIIFFLSITATSRKEAFLYPFISGVVSAAGLLYWIPRLMGSGLYVVLIVGMFLLFAYMALWVGLVSLATYQAHRVKASLAYVVFPIVWVAQEKIREMGEISFPWITAGYSFGSYTNLLQSLSLFGVYFFSLLIAVTAVMIVRILLNRRNIRLVVTNLGTIVLIFTSLTIYGHFRVAAFDKGDKSTFRVALIQSNIDPLIKWERGRADSIFRLHMEMSNTAAASNPKPNLLVWAESALPVYFSLEGRIKKIINKTIDSTGIPIIFGSLDIEFPGNRNEEKKYFNSVFFKNPNELFVRYDKVRLLPFAERLPFEGIFPIISRVDLGEADFTPGDTMMLFKVGEVSAFAPICYEVVYQETIRDFVKKSGTLMAHVTNDGWFGRSAMPYQHLNIALYRSIEFGIPLARCANTGVSASADACGRIIDKTDIYENKIIITDIPKRSISTLFTKTGDIVGFVCLIITMILIIFRVIWLKLK